MQRARFVGLVIVACLVGMIMGCQKAGSVTGTDPEAVAAGDRTQQRIGVYDTRCVAVAFAGTPKHEAQIEEDLAALEAARAGGDPEKIAAADERVWESRKRLHRQGFGIAPVDDILAMFPEQVGALMDRQNIAALVSQWDKQALARLPDAQRVDVTEELIDMLGPNDRQRLRALEIRDHKPLTSAQVEELIRQEIQ